MKERTEQCEAVAAQFAKDDEERKRELEILGRLLAYFTENVKTIENYIKDRVNEWEIDS